MSQTNQESAPSSLDDGLLHAPDRRFSNFIKWYESRYRSEGISWEVPTIDQRVVPMYPGDLVGLMGRPGMGKTSLLAFLTKRTALRLAEDGQDDKCVVYVAWEGTAEEMEAYMLTNDQVTLSDIAWGRVEPEQLIRMGQQSMNLPIYVIGHSLLEETNGYLTPTTVFDKVQRIREQTGRRPVLVALDYIQIMELDDFQVVDRTPRIVEATIRAKHMAKRMAVPIVMGVQAGRRVDDRNPPIPQQRDPEYSSSIEQACDKLFGLWRPIKTLEAGDDVVLGGRIYGVSDTLLIMRLLKQRMEGGSGTWALHFDPARLRLGEMTSMNRGDSNNGSWSEPGRFG